MRIEKHLCNKVNCRSLLIQPERTLYNIDEQANAPVESVTFEQLSDLRTHLYLASQFFGQGTINIKEPLPSIPEQLTLLDVISHCADITLNIDDSILAKDVEPLLKEFMESSILRYRILKKKKVGEN